MSLSQDPLFESAGRAFGDTWIYAGCINLEEGGLFYRPGSDISAIDIWPDRDVETPDRAADAWYINVGGHIPADEEAVRTALEISDWKLAAGCVHNADSASKLTGIAARCLIIEAAYSCEGIENGTLHRVTRRELESNDISLSEYVHQRFLRKQ